MKDLLNPSWFNNLRGQDQLMLVVGAAAVVLYLIFILLIRPLSASVFSLELQNDRARESLQEVKQLAAEYQALQRSGAKAAASNKSLTRLIDETVKRHQLEMTRFQPSSSGDVQVRFDNVRFNNVIAWLNELESKQGVGIKDLSVSNSSAAGIVNVTVRLRQGA